MNRIGIKHLPLLIPARVQSRRKLIPKTPKLTNISHGSRRNNAFVYVSNKACTFETFLLKMKHLKYVIQEEATIKVPRTLQSV